MKTKLDYFVKETTWLFGIEHGWGNGYVVLPKGHKYYGVHYDEIDVTVHGGLTFSQYANKLDKSDWPELKSKSGWVVGFDTAHCDDSLINWPKAKVIRETKKLLRQLQ